MSDPTPAETEAKGDPVVLEWCGETVELPASPDDWDIDVTRAFERNNVVTALEALLGPAVFGRIEKAHRAAHGGKMLNRDLQPLSDKLAEIYGFESAGNS